MKTLNTTIRALLATALLGIATLAQAALCITGPAQGVPGTGFTPFASLERLEVRAGRPGNQDWEWGLGTNTQQAGQFITAQLNWVNDRVYRYTLTYNGAGAATLTVSDGSTTLFTRSWATGMDTGNALKFYIKANAGIGAGNRISATITAINGQAVNESLATSGNNLFEEQARFFASEGLRTGFTVEGTVKLTFTGSAPPQGSRLNLMVNAGNIACETQANAQLYFIHTDHLNTPRLITNTVGLPVWRWDNDDPYGNNAPNENPSGAGNFTCNLRLPGQYFDAELNTHYNYFRDYDPAIGRYVQSDPIGLRGGINTYAYGGSDPLRRTDPRGLCPWCIGAGIGGISAAVGAGQSLGWTRENALTIISAGAVGAVAGAFGAWWTPFGTVSVAANVANNMYAGAAAGFVGNLVGQKVAQPECVPDIRQATFQGAIGLFGGLATVAAFGPYPVAYGAQWAAGISGGVGLGVNALYSTDLGGFVPQPAPIK